mgnify:FL=1
MDFFKIDERLQKLDAAVLQQCSKPFAEIEKTTEYCQLKVLNAFIENGVSESHFAATTGYGYDDRGRDTLDRVVAQSLGAEDALLRYSFASGTHTIAVALFGVLRPGDRLLCVTGRPYDTLIGVLGCDEKTSGSLADFNIEYNEVALKPDGTPNHAAITEELKSGAYKVAYIQRSRGYSLRPSLQIAEIERLCQTIRAAAPGVIIMVDNCYGEFTHRQEPCCVGADLIMGSLIKNPGGGIAPSGGYIAGRKELIEQCAYRMTAPGVGREIGATLGHNRELFMGWFNAPHVTGEALKTAVFAAAFFESCGYTVTPTAAEPRADIIQSIVLENPKALIAFCQGMQRGAPVDSFVTPEPWDMPGYNDQVIMAAGAFTLGSSIDLSADAPLREPYAAWMQGGLNFHSAHAGVLLAAQSMLENGLLKGFE